MRAKRTRFLASAPGTVTPQTGRALCNGVLADAADATRTVADAFKGTVPPPPWPAGPELVAARERVGKLRDGFAVLADRGVTTLAPAAAVTLALEVRSSGDALYKEALALLEKAEAAADPLTTMVPPSVAANWLPLALIGALLLWDAAS